MHQPQDHPLRQILNDEIHGRAGHAIEAPSELLHFAYTLDAADADPALNVASLCRQLKRPEPMAGALHHAIEFEHGGLLRFEKHGEFYRISLSQRTGRSPQSPASLVPPGWLESLPGQVIVAIRTQVLSRKGRRTTSPDMIKVFGHADIASSSIGQGEATVWTDFRIADDGFTRFVVESHGMAPLRLGRALRRLHEIETYRMMALLALPVARMLQPKLKEVEAELNSVSSDMQSSDSSDDDAQLLSKLTKIAKTVEDMSSQSSYRFSAARAYAVLVGRRIEELNEERVPTHQRLGVFLDRRFSPAMATCQAVESRLASLASRCERASNLLRTRVDIALERQNQELLASMNRRAQQQLKLQETVEGLSVVAISYYAWALLSKLAESLGKVNGWYDQNVVNLVLIPIVVAIVWYAIRKARKRLW